MASDFSWITLHIAAQEAELAAGYGGEDDTEPLDLSVFAEPGAVLLLAPAGGQAGGCGATSLCETCAYTRIPNDGPSTRRLLHPDTLNLC